MCGEKMLHVVTNVTCGEDGQHQTDVRGVRAVRIPKEDKDVHARLTVFINSHTQNAGPP